MDKAHILWLIGALYWILIAGLLGLALALSSALMMAPLFRHRKAGLNKVWQALPIAHRHFYIGSAAAFFGGFLALWLVKFLTGY